MTVRALGYLAAESPDAKEWLTFGPDILGMAAEQVGEGTVALRMDDHSHRITIHEGPRNRLRYLGWDTGSREALDRITATAERVGFTCTEGTEEDCANRAVLGLARVTDPAGIDHELFYGLEVEPKSFQPGRPLSGFVTGPQGLGHAVLFIPELASVEAFYLNVLGFHKSDEIHTFLNLNFYHCNPRHHSLALATMPGMRGLHHIMVQLNELDDVGIAYDLCKQQGLPISMTLGRHTNDQMVSFYVRSPSGFDIEYGWGAIEVDDQSWSVAKFNRASVWGHQMADLPPGAVEPTD
ncbi:VOC family protein [Mycobacterium helveticum]|jgi:extradiol dioxygenase|uniref:Glyoxalase n=1 Tax=Mycobacterium helveticum TaxID=2592811 RepID=A0A557XR87_9MYCO|nr:VOC family protein [Mycobacterium helveticum]TVS85083.1 glyoxalase [Mycobacterium helveticum]TVS88446.1 glyoxalase [Mycobacterium helveticum]